MNVATSALNHLYRTLNVLLVLSVAVLIIPVLLQIFSRYLGFIPRYIWTEELARFCFVWMIMIGAMVAVRDSSHFDVDLLPQLPLKVNAILRIAMHSAMLFFALIFLYYGNQFVEFGANQTSELAELPMWMIFISWPLAGLVWIFFLGEKFVADFKILFGSAQS